MSTISKPNDKQTTSEADQKNRWWIYQAERFPIIPHSTLVAVFSFSGLCVSALLRGTAVLPSAKASLVAFVVALLFFVLLRVADEFKDFEDDRRYRAYRPVPRGLVRLRELGWLGACAMAVQLAATCWLDPRLVPILAVGWLYWALMSKEFFVGTWLKAQQLLYMGSHMVIMVLITLFITACDWLLAQASAPQGLGWFLGTSFCSGVVLEIGRKIRAPHDEERGVATYSQIWGVRRAVLSWVGAMVFAAACAIGTATAVAFVQPAGVVCVALLLPSLFAGVAFIRNPSTKRAKQFELLSSVWTLASYLMLGIAPLAIHILERHG